MAVARWRRIGRKVVAGTARFRHKLLVGLAILVAVAALVNVASPDRAAAATPETTLVVTMSSLPVATVGLPYHAQITAGGGSTPYHFSISEGVLPAGLSLSSDGEVTGTATTTASGAVVVGVTDAIGDEASGIVRISVKAADPPGFTWQGHVVDAVSPIVAISCPSSTFCMALDFSGNAVWSKDGGVTWTTPLTIDQIAPGNTVSFESFSLSCASESYCAALDVTGKGLIWNGSSWSTPQQLFVGLLGEGVSCAPGTTFCLAVGFEPGKQSEAVSTQGETSWSSPVQIVAPAPVQDFGNGSTVEGETGPPVCFAAGSCVVQVYSMQDLALFWFEGASTWKIMPTDLQFFSLLGGRVSCTVQPFCMSLGSLIFFPTPSLPGFWNGTEWLQVLWDQPFSHVIPPPSLTTQSLSCAYSTECVEVGTTNGVLEESTFLYQSGSNMWSTPQPIDEITSDYTYSASVSCAPSTPTSVSTFCATAIGPFVFDGSGPPPTKPPAPSVVTSVSPDFGPQAGGTTVSIAGENLSSATEIMFGNTVVTNLFCNSNGTSCTATTPSGHGTVQVTAASIFGSASQNSPPTFTYIGPPMVTSVTPRSGSVGGGTDVTIEGDNLLGTTAVDFGTSPAESFKVVSSSEIQAVSPPGEGTVDVTVTNSEGTSATSPQDQFTYTMGLSISGTDDCNGSAVNGTVNGGTTFCIYGTGFSTAPGGTSFYIGQGPLGFAQATHVSCSDSEDCQAVTPPAPGGQASVDAIQVVSGGQSFTTNPAQVSFTYYPEVYSVTPAEGFSTGGELVEIKGAGFAPGRGSATTTEFGICQRASCSTKAPLTYCKSSTDCLVLTPPYPLGPGDTVSLPVLVDVVVTSEYTGGESLGSFNRRDVQFLYEPPPPCSGSCHVDKNPTTCSTGSPVDCASGNFYHTFTDVSVKGSGPGLVLTRTYNAQGAQTSNGPFGYGWSCSYCMSLTFNKDGTITYTADDGSQATADPDASGGWQFATQVDASITKNADGTYHMVFHGNEDFTFSSSGKLLAVAGPSGEATHISYDATGHISSVTDASGRSITFTTNADGLVTSATDPMGRTTSYKYDSAGDLVSVTDPMGRVQRFGYDSTHEMTSMTDPRGGTLTNTYDLQSRVVAQTDPMGRITTFLYEGNNYSSTGGTTTISYPGGEVVQEHYVEGMLMSATKQPGTNETATWSYTYDQATGGRTSVTGPEGNKTLMTYDASGNLTSVTDPLGRTTTTTYNAFGEPTSSTNPEGITTTYTYNADGELTSTSTPDGAASITTTLSYGNPQQPEEVTSSTNPDGETWHYSYDASGNLTSATDPLGHTTAYTYNADGERTSSTTAIGAATTYTYNADGELTSVNSSELTASYTYDAAGLRNSATTNGTTQVFTWNVATSTPQILSDGTNDYIYGPSGMPIEQIDTATATPTYLHEDQLGSIRLLTDATGKVVGTKSFSAYGALVAQAGITTPLGFAGGYTDPTGLVYLVNRYYDPATGQFLTVDPLVNLTGSPYAYAGNDPLNMTDPTGLFCWQALELGLTGASRQCWASGYANLWNFLYENAGTIAKIAGLAAFALSFVPGADIASLVLGAVATTFSAIQTEKDIATGASGLTVGLDLLSTVLGVASLGVGAAAEAATEEATNTVTEGNLLVGRMKLGQAVSEKQISRLLGAAGTLIGELCPS